MGERKRAIFCIIPVNDGSMNYLVSMLLTQCFQQLYLRSDERYNGRLPVPVRVIQDEWANVAQPDSYPKVLATCRSYNIGINIIVQNIHSIKALYKDEWETVIGNCDTLLFLGGGNEPTSLEFISKLLGKETVHTRTRGQTKGRSGSSSVNFQQTGRDLMTPDEIRMLPSDDALLLIRGEKPVRDKKYDIRRHPMCSAPQTAERSPISTIRLCRTILCRICPMHSVHWTISHFWRTNMKTKKTKTMARSVCAGVLLLCCVVPAHATASDPLSIVNNLSDFIFSIIKAIGIIMLTARTQEMDKVTGLMTGADDYVTKPFNILELKARIKALLRRAGGPSRAGRSPALLTVGDLSLDTEQRVALRDGRTIDLTAKEYDLIELLMKNPRRVYSRESLMNLVWGYSYAGDYRTVDVHIRRLREKLEKTPAEPEYIMTKWGVGYYFAGENQPTV